MKLIVVWQLHDHILLQPASGLDTTAYTALARRVVDGDIALGPGLYFVSPLYIYFLAVPLALAGSFTAALIVQAALGTAAVGFVFVMARDWGSERAAWISAALLALTGMVTFYESVLVQAALDPFLTAAALACLTLALTRDGGRWFGLAGAAFGLEILNRPNALVAVLAVLLCLVITRRVRGALLAAAGLALVLAPVTIRNVVVTGEWSALSSQGGLNFYIGNNPGADGTYRPVPGISASIEGQQFDARRVAEQARGYALSDGEVSGYFFRRGLDWISEHTAAATALFVRKLAYVLNAGPIFLNFSYPFFAYDTSTLLRLLLVGPGLLIPLGVLGCALITRQRRPGWLLWLSYGPAYAVGTAVFFVSDRYQLPLLIPCAVGAGVALEALVAAIRSRQIRSLAGMCAALAALAVIVNWPFRLDDGRAEERARMAERLVMLERYAEAEQWSRRAEEGYPNLAVLHFRVGQRFLVAHQPALARRHLERAYQLDPSQPEVAYRLGQALFETGQAHESLPYLRQGVDAGLDVDLVGYDLARALAASGDRNGALSVLERVRPSKMDAAQNDFALGQFALQLEAPAVAETFFRRAVGAAPQLAGAHQQLGIVLGMTGRLEDGIRELREAIRLAPSDPASHLNLAVVFAQAGRFSEARAEAETALGLDPRYDRARQLLAALPK